MRLLDFIPVCIFVPLAQNYRQSRLHGVEPIHSGMVLPFLLIVLANDPATALVRCAVIDDPQARVYELLRSGEGERTRWMLGMRGREAGATQLVMPLPDAKPQLKGDAILLDYRTQNGGREVRWNVGPGGASLSVYANFELEVNVEADLDPRVELMNTDGPIGRLSCTIPKAAPPVRAEDR